MAKKTITVCDLCEKEIAGFGKNAMFAYGAAYQEWPSNNGTAHVCAGCCKIIDKAHYELAPLESLGSGHTVHSLHWKYPEENTTSDDKEISREEFLRCNHCGSRSTRFFTSGKQYCTFCERVHRKENLTT